MLTYYHLWKMNPIEARRILVKEYEDSKSYCQTASLSPGPSRARLARNRPGPPEQPHQWVGVSYFGVMRL